MTLLDNKKYKAFEDFLGEWGNELQKGANVVYYIGTSLWLPCDSFGSQVVPNFVVRTTDPKWTRYPGRPHGVARHDFVLELDSVALQEFYGRWSGYGWTPPPAEQGSLELALQEPSNFVRIIEVPASSAWFGPEKLSLILDGLSVEYTHQKSLRRYNPDVKLFDPPAHYYAVDETAIVAP